MFDRNSTMAKGPELLRRVQIRGEVVGTGAQYDEKIAVQHAIRDQQIDMFL